MPSPVSSAVVAGTNAQATEANNIRIDAITRYVRLYFTVEGSLSVQDALQTITIPAGMTVTKIKHRCVSGSGTLRVKTVAGAVIKSGMSVATSYTDETTGLTNTVLAEGDEVQIDLTGSSSLVTIRVVVYCTEVLT